MEDFESKLESLIRRVIDGDESAFDDLIRNFRHYVYTFARCHLKQHEDSEDILQNTFLNAHQALRNGHYQHHNLAAFKGWLKTIAWREIIYHHKNRKVAESLYTLDQDGNEMLMSPPDQATTGEAVEHLSLFEFLDRQLDEVLIKSQPTPQDKDIGLLKKLAFMHFYVDCFSQKQIVTIISAHAARLCVAVAISQATINNWTSRGDILRLLIRRLVERHHDLLGKLTGAQSVWAALTEIEKDLLQQSWKYGESEETIASKAELALSEIENSLRTAKRKVADALFLMIKQELHNLRHDRQS